MKLKGEKEILHGELCDILDRQYMDIVDSHISIVNKDDNGNVDYDKIASSCDIVVNALKICKIMYGLDMTTDEIKMLIQCANKENIIYRMMSIVEGYEITNQIIEFTIKIGAKINFELG